MSYQRITLSALLICIAFGLAAQSKLNLAAKIGVLYGEADVQSKSLSLSDPNSRDDRPNTNVSLAFSLLVKGNFRLGAELGLVSYRMFLEQNFNVDFTSDDKFYGRYRISQFFATIVPEYRIKEWFYLNAGAGLYLDYNSYFTQGTVSTGPETTDITGVEYKRSNAFGYFAGAGICPRVTKELAILAEARYTGSPASLKAGEEVAIGYGAFNFNVGLMFKL